MRYETEQPWRLCEDDGDGRTIEALAVPYDTDVDFGGYRERVAPGAIDIAALVGVPLLWRHDEPIGRVVAAHDTPAGPLVRARVSRTSRGDESLQLVADQAVRGVSIGFDPVEDTRDGATTVRTTIDVREVSLTAVPAYKDAQVLAVRERQETPTMTDTVTLAAEPEQTRAAGRVLDDVAVNEVREFLAHRHELVDRIAALEGRGTPGGHPLAQYRDLAEYARAVYAGTETRAWIDQITTNNPGVVPPAWIRDVKGIVDASRPAVEATGGAAALPAAGMDIAWPYFDGDLTALVGEQTTQKTDITSVRVDIKKGTSAIKTYAGGSDLSLQLIQRSDPAYLDAYLRIMYAAYAVVTDKAYAASLFGGAGSTVELDIAGLDAPKWRAFVFAANSQVKTVTGQGASSVLLSTDLFQQIGGLTEQPGTGFLIDQPTPTLVEVPSLADGSVVVTNSAAARWHEDGPRSISDDVVSKLGLDVAVYGFAAPALYLPKGIVKNAAPTP